MMTQSWSLPWCKMVVQNMLRTFGAKKVFPEKTCCIWRLFRCQQMPSTNRNAWFTLFVRIVKSATIWYKKPWSEHCVRKLNKIGVMIIKIVKEEKNIINMISKLKYLLKFNDDFILPNCRFWIPSTQNLMKSYMFTICPRSSFPYCIVAYYING